MPDAPVIASEAKPSTPPLHVRLTFERGQMDCFVASLLAMTILSNLNTNLRRE
jgi:hypothetical protein